MCRRIPSLPSWERGLKFCVGKARTSKFSVAPLVGARIEILPFGKVSLNGLSSLPSWERGLKYVGVWLGKNDIVVAPLVGARIEILTLCTVIFRFFRRSPRGSAD